MRLKDKVAIVTGGSSGIGRSIVLGFAREGAKVVINATREEKCVEVAEEVKKTGGDAIYYVMDVANLDDHKNLLSYTIDEFGKFDILVNNAAYSVREEILEVTPESWDKQMDIGLRALLKSGSSFPR